MRYLKYLFNYILSLIYDIYYFFFGNIRARTRDLAYYKATKLYPDYLKSGNRVEVVKFLAEKYCRGRGVDIGAGNWPLKGARAIENNKEENAYKIKEADNSLDFVFSSHTLEHLDKWQDALKGWHRALKSGGVLFLYLPHPYCKMWQKDVLKHHKWDIDINLLVNFISAELSMEVKKVDYLPDSNMSFTVIAEKVKK